MPVVTKSVNKTAVKGQEVFIYTYNVSYSGLTQPATNGTLVDFFPSNIQYSLPPIGGGIVSISTAAVSGGVNVTFNFGPVTAGTSLTFNVSCNFGPGSVNGGTFTNIADIFADDVKVGTATAQTVTLTLVEKFTLLKYPTSGGAVKAGDVVTFQLALQNDGDLGAVINNVVIADILPATLIPLTSFTPVGNEINTGSPYGDPTYNGKTGTWTGQTLNFTLPSYKGAAYAVTFKATVAASVTPGETITNTATWTANSVARPDANTTIQVYKPTSIGFVAKNAPLYATVGQPIQYEVDFSNGGTELIISPIVTDTLPEEVSITKAAIYIVDPLQMPNYGFYIETSDAPGVYKTVVTGLNGISGVIDLAPTIPAGQRVLSLQVRGASLKNISVYVALYLYGTVSATATPNKVITNNAQLTGATDLGSIDVTSSGNTTLNGKSILKISKSLWPSRSSYNVLDQFYVALHTDAFTSAIVNPVFADLYPLGMTYKNNYYYVFVDAMTGTQYDSRQPGFPLPIPAPEVIPNYNGSGRTLVRVAFDNFTLLLRNQLTVYLDSIVSVGSPDTVTNIGYLGNPGSNASVDGAPYTDALDLDGDTITTEQIAQSAPVTFTVLSSSQFVIQKFVKGQLDSSYSDAGFTTAGGDITYNLAIANNKNLTLKNIQIVDILPYVGDTGVILNTTPRGSQFDVYPTTTITADVINLIGNPVTPPIIEIYYSTSNDPVRFDETGTGTIGTGSWSLVPPVDITTIASIKVVTDPTTILNPYDVLTVSIKAKAPVGVAVGKIAYNSFAVVGDQVSGSTVTPLLPTEPNKVSAEIRSTTNASIGSFVWNDLNNNGLYEPSEPKMNGVTVQLYDNAGNLLKSTATTNDGDGNPGSYLFTDLVAGTYVVKFIPLAPYTLTVKTAGGSTPNQTTGFTDPIILAGTNITTINAGIVGQTCPPPTIYASDKCLHVGDTFNPLAGVTATDCAGKDITSSIIVTANNVNTAVAGNYSVTYSVTDSKNQTTIKTIAVKVCQGSPYAQAIADIIVSVALIQTATAAVLDAEGAKVQKFMTLNPTPQQLIDVNASVKAMVDTIKKLELVLQGKLNAVACDNCSGDCCP